MENLLNRNVREIEISGIRKFYNLMSNYKNVISLTIGQPDFPTPRHIKEFAKNSINDNKTIYTPNAGLLELRLAAEKYFEAKYKLTYNSQTEIIVTNGASEAIDIALRTILEPGTEVILPGPIYPGYEPIIKLCGAKAVYVDTTKTNFKLTQKLLSESITDKTRCVILPYPSNPTGCTLDYNEISSLAELLCNKDIFILSDEIYSELNFSDKHTSIGNFEAMREKTIIINGLSKSHSMTGWRIGFTLAPEYITKNMLKVHQYNATCACTISQYAALEALVNGQEDALDMRIEYKARRDYVYERLLSLGFDVVKPNGAFYIFPSIKNFGMSSQEFALSLLEKAGVAVVPGDAFSPLGEGFIRLSYACSTEILTEGLDRIEDFVRIL